MIYSFRYRDGVRGVTTKHVEAASIVEADKTALAWVNRRPGATYIPNSCEPWLISLSDLPPAVEETSGPVKADAPTLGEQKQRLAKAGAERMAGTGVGSAVKQEGRVGA